MGLIARQSIKSSLVNFIGAAVGMVSVLFIYPLHREAVGFANTFYSIALFISPVFALGINSVAVKYYHEFRPKDDTDKRGFLPFLLLTLLIYFSVFILLTLIFKQYIYDLLDLGGFNSKTISLYEPYIATLVLVLMLINLFNAYISNFGRIVIPSLIINLGYKVYLPMVILLIFYQYFVISDLVALIIVFNLSALVALIAYLKTLGSLDLDFKNLSFDKNRIKDIFTFSFFSGLTGIGSVLAFRIDTIMIAGFLGYALTGSYILPMTMAAVLDIPNQAINSISAPIISKAWSEGNLPMIKTIYKKASLNLLIIGSLITMCGWFCFDSLAGISSNPAAFSGTKMVFLVLAITKLIDLATSVNSLVIAYSDYYKFNLLFVLILGIVNVFLNILFIPKYGIIGAAYATFIAMTMFNIMKLTFIYLRFRLHPFSSNLFTLALIVLCTSLMAYFLPLSYIPILNIIYISALITSVFGISVYLLKLSPDINETINQKLRLVLNSNKGE